MLMEFLCVLRMALADSLDILLVALIIYQVFRWIRGSSVISSIFMAILALYVLRVVVAALNMRLMSAILGTVLDVGVIALIVIFQPEIRRILTKLGSRYRITTNGNGILSKIFGSTDSKLGSEAVKELTEACRSMSLEKTGALIVLQHETRLDYIEDTGDRIDANINRRLIMNLFFKNSPLHDGAVIISNGRIVAARCTLPITEKTDIPPSFGMRHKAATGITEETDADVIVVSEETGNISFVKGGQVKRISNINELKLLLTNSFAEQKKEKTAQKPD